MSGGHPVISLFGGLRIRAPNGGPDLGLSGAARELLAYLVVHAGKPVRRDRVTDLFWPELDECRGRAALNTAVWRLNKQLRPLPGVGLRSSAEALGLDLDPAVDVDVRRLEEAVRLALSPAETVELAPCARFALAAAVDLYTAPFLEGSTSEWAVVERERLHSLHLRGLALLMQDCGLHRDYEGALEYGRRVLAADPFREQVQCAVMWLHVLNGQRAGALQQYRAYHALLARELGIAPMAEMRALAEHIQADPDVERRFADAHASLRGPDPLAEFLAAVERTRLDTWRALNVG